MQLKAVQKHIEITRARPAIHDSALGRSMLDDGVGSYKTPLYAMFAATGCVLLIACMNVASLLVARAAARRKEHGHSIGAGRRTNAPAARAHHRKPAAVVRRRRFGDSIVGRGSAVAGADARRHEPHRHCPYRWHGGRASRWARSRCVPSFLDRFRLSGRGIRKFWPRCRSPPARKPQAVPGPRFAERSWYSRLD